jgi:predicted TIM-barrel fold metal-dependent hydrolase
MFGSNFPVEKLWTTYARLVEVFRASLARYTETDRRQILHDVAAQVYRLDPPNGTSGNHPRRDQ